MSAILVEKINDKFYNDQEVLRLHTVIGDKIRMLFIVIQYSKLTFAYLNPLPAREKNRIGMIVIDNDQYTNFIRMLLSI